MFFISGDVLIAPEIGEIKSCMVGDVYRLDSSRNWQWDAVFMPNPPVIVRLLCGSEGQIGQVVTILGCGILLDSCVRKKTY